MFKSMEYVRVLGVAMQGSATTWQYGWQMAARSSISLEKAFLAYSMSWITRECHAKPKNYEKCLNKPGMKLREPGQTDKLL